MEESAIVRWTWNVEPNPSAPALARRAVVDAARSGRTHADLEAVEVATSELVTNAVLHAGPPIKMAVDDDDGTRLRVEVSDASSQLPAPRRPDDRGGRGLHLVRALVPRCGWEATASGKTVWFELDASRVD